MPLPPPRLSPKIDQCIVCGTPLSVRRMVRIDHMEEVVTVCSPACGKAYLDDPKKYQPSEEEFE